MKLKNYQYDRIKWFVQVFLPYFGTFVGGVGLLYGWTETDKAVTLITLVTAFLAGIMQISSKNYEGESNEDV